MVTTKSTPKRKIDWDEVKREIAQSTGHWEILQTAICKRCVKKIQRYTETEPCLPPSSSSPLPVTPQKDPTEEPLSTLLDELKPLVWICPSCHYPLCTILTVQCCTQCGNIYTPQETLNE